MQGCKEHPQQPNPTKMGLHIPTRLSADAALGGEADGVAAGGGEDGYIPRDEAQASDPLVRRTPITHKEIDKYGPTPGCAGCQAKIRGEVTRRGHSDKCRQRIEEGMRKDETHKKTLDRADERMTHNIATYIEKTGRKRKIATRVSVAHGDMDTGVEEAADTGA